MRTTIALDAAVRDELLERKRQWRAPSLEAVITQLLSGPPASAEQLYRSHRKSVDAVLRRHGIRRLTAFGSRARGDARPDSDLDLACPLPPKADLLTAVRVQDDLTNAFGLKVHLVAGKPDARLAQVIAAEGVVLVG